jgi:dTDP-4-dehydrorhamnose reductase
MKKALIYGGNGSLGKELVKWFKNSDYVRSKARLKVLHQSKNTIVGL